MKKLLLICMVLSLVLFMVTISSAGSKKAETVNGYVSDSQCGAKGAVAGQEECTHQEVSGKGCESGRGYGR